METLEKLKTSPYESLKLGFDEKQVRGVYQRIGFTCDCAGTDCDCNDCNCDCVWDCNCSDGDCGGTDC